VIAPPNLSLLLIMACFWMVFFLVWTQLVKPLGVVLDERDKRVREAKNALADVQERFSAAVARCERELAVGASEAAKERAALRAAGETARRARLDAAREQAQERLAKLATEIGQASGAARAELRTSAQALARELAERLVGRRLVR
jgi:F0F1-type ATP synthase membrane subunit b/b'